jgi:hypothetical protein
MLDDADQLESSAHQFLALAHEFLARAAALRGAEKSAQTAIELPEADMARRLRVDAEVLRSHRRLGNCPGLWRSVGRSKLWLVGATEAWAAIKLPPLSGQ